MDAATGDILVLVGKPIEALWWKMEPCFTDVGCTYRAIWRDAYSGESKHSSSRWHSVRTGLRVPNVIVRKRLNVT